MPGPVLAWQVCKERNASTMHAGYKARRISTFWENRTTTTPSGSCPTLTDGSPKIAVPNLGAACHLCSCSPCQFRIEPNMADGSSEWKSKGNDIYQWHVPWPDSEPRRGGWRECWLWEGIHQVFTYWLVADRSDQQHAVQYINSLSWDRVSLFLSSATESSTKETAADLGKLFLLPDNWTPPGPMEYLVSRNGASCRELNMCTNGKLLSMEHIGITLMIGLGSWTGYTVL